jgi:hypothetical protein
VAWLMTFGVCKGAVARGGAKNDRARSWAKLMGSRWRGRADHGCLQVAGAA